MSTLIRSVSKDPALGQRLQKARERSGLTQEEVAQKLGVHVQTVSDYERGKITPRESRLRVLAELYKVPLPELRYGPALLAAMETIGAEDPWLPNPTLKSQVPARAYDVAMSYMRRLVAVGLPRHQLEEMERLLLDSRYARSNSRRGELTEDDHILLIDDTWDAIRETLGFSGIRP